MLTLFHHPMSSASRFIRLILKEYQIDVQLVTENTWEKRRPFLALNPAGTLPVLLTLDNVAISGAFPIFEYLDETCGVFKKEQRLFPENPIQRAENRRLLEWFLVKFNQEITYHLIYERILTRLMPNPIGGGAPNSTILRTARANIPPHMKYVEWLANSRDWLGGNAFSSADLAAASEFSVLDYTGEIDWSLYPIAREWYSRVKSRPSFRSILLDRIQGLSPVSHYADLDF